MQARTFAFLAITFFSNFAMSEMVRVRTHKNLSQMHLKLESGKIKVCKEERSQCNSFQMPNGSLRFELKNNALYVGGKSGFSGKDIFLEASKLVDLQNNQLLPNHLEFVFKENKMDVVAHIDLENYLLGVLPSEMPASWPLESLKAQAVASRSYVLAQIRGNRRLHFDVDSDIMDQVFKKQKETAALKNVRRALLETKGEVISRSQRPVKAYFHSHCGGHTEMASNVWPGSLGFETVKDPYCSGSSPMKWSQELSYSELAKLYDKDTKDTSVGKLVKVQKGERNFSGRVESIYLFFDNNKIRRWSALNLREKVGYGKIKSTRFEMDDSIDGKIVFHGKGFGHGVGLCQHGAKAMAALGKNYHDILKHYYPLTKLSALSDLQDANLIGLKASSELKRY